MYKVELLYHITNNPFPLHLPVADDSLYNHISCQFTATVDSLEDAPFLGFLIVQRETGKMYMVVGSFTRLQKSCSVLSCPFSTTHTPPPPPPYLHVVTKQLTPFVKEGPLMYMYP